MQGRYFSAARERDSSGSFRKLFPLHSRRGSGPQHTVFLGFLPHDVVQRQNRHNDTQQRKIIAYQCRQTECVSAIAQKTKHHQKKDGLPQAQPIGEEGVSPSSAESERESLPRGLQSSRCPDRERSHRGYEIHLEPDCRRAREVGHKS